MPTAMQYVNLGRTGCKVSRLCLGTMNFGPQTSEADSFAIMDKALELGINFFDTADVYGWKKGEGVTEQIIGRWFAQGGNRRERVILATKAYNDMEFINGDVTITQVHLDAGISGGQALIAAATAGRAETVSLLLTRVGAKTSVAARALAQARAANHTATVAALQSAGVTLDAADPSGDTALMLAVREHREDEWDLLVKLGSELKCLNTHFRGTGDFCPGSGADPFEHMVAPQPARPVPE